MNRLRAVLLLILALVLPAARVQSDDKVADLGDVVAFGPLFEALLTDGTTATGRIRQLGPGGNLALVVDQAERTIPLGLLVKLTREGTFPSSPTEGTRVLFPDGDRLRAAIGLSSETALEIVPSALGDEVLSVPLNALLGAVLTVPPEPDDLEPLVAKVRSEPRTADVLWLANGDRLTGSVLDLTPRKVGFQADAAPLAIDRTGVLAFGFDPKQVKYPRPDGLFLELTLTDGSRLGVTDCRVEHGQVLATTRFGAPVKLARTELARVHVRSDAIVYLSEQTEAAVVYEGYVGPSRPYRRDLNVEGQPLRLGGQPYDRGLGTQSRTLLAYKLDGRDRRFQALVGLDDRAGPLGSVVFRVKVDGEDR
ncbi:MAG: NPCBM/NEW2 domain-containing protein, partial [Isosphaeraceae bacterium]